MLPDSETDVGFRGLDERLGVVKTATGRLARRALWLRPVLGQLYCLTAKTSAHSGLVSGRTAFSAELLQWMWREIRNGKGVIYFTRADVT